MAKQLRRASAAASHSAVLDLIRSSGVVSRIELADRSGLTEASISRIVKQLLADGLIAEIGVGDRTGGKRRTLLQLDPTARHAVGITLDFTAITYVVADLSGRVVFRSETAGIGVEAPATVTRRVAREVVGIIARAGIDPASLIGIGVAVAGRQDGTRHVLRSNPNATDWEFFDLEDTLGHATGLDVVVENDSTCAAIGEFWVGRISAGADFATVYLASGFGLGLITDGGVYRGASSNVGEIGHMIIDADGPPCWCGSQGCLEMLAAPARIVELGMARPRLAAALGLEQHPFTVREHAARVADAAAQGDPDAVAVIEESAYYLSRALVSLTNLLDLDQIILAGPGFGAAGEIYVRQAEEALGRLPYARAIHPTKVSLSKSSDISAALGAASLVMHTRLTPHHTSTRPARPVAIG